MIYRFQAFIWARCSTLYSYMTALLLVSRYLAICSSIFGGCPPGLSLAWQNAFLLILILSFRKFLIKTNFRTFFSFIFYIYRIYWIYIFCIYSGKLLLIVFEVSRRNCIYFFKAWVMALALIKHLILNNFHVVAHLYMRFWLFDETFSSNFSIDHILSHNVYRIPSIF